MQKNRNQKMTRNKESRHNHGNIIKKSLTALIIWLAATTTVHALTFNEAFTDSTLRLDYVLAGNAHEQHIYFCEAQRTSRWAGRRARLTEAPLRGNGQITLTDHATGRLLFVHTFSTLFQEWQATEEATRLDRAFPASFNVPMPKRPVDVTITLTDFHAKVTGRMLHTLDPADILIRQIAKPATPFYYVWKGQTLANGLKLWIDYTACPEKAVAVRFLNRYDVPQTMMTIQPLDVKPAFHDQTQLYLGNRVRYSVEQQDEYTLRSGVIHSQSEYASWADLVTSRKAEVYYEGQWLPIIVTKSNFTVIRRSMGRPHVEISFRMADPKQGL